MEECEHELETIGYETDEFGNSWEIAKCTKCGQIFK